MANILTITKSGELKRIDNSLVFIESNSLKKTKIPILTISQIDIYSYITLTSEVLYFLSKNDIGIHFFHQFTEQHYGDFNMWNSSGSEKLLVKQCQTYLNNALRHNYIKQIYKGIQNNLIYLLNKYQKRSDIGKEITLIMKDLKSIDVEKMVFDNYMLFEATMWIKFYTSIDLIIQKKEFKFEKRTKRPPENYINSLISFINTKLYYLVNSVIKTTKLDNRIGFVHELSDKGRFALALDISELFKPLFTFYFIFQNINMKKITLKDFQSDNLKLTEEGLKKINSLFFDFYNKSIYYEKLNRKVSLKHLIKLECYKLIKSLYLEQEYIAISFKNLNEKNEIFEEL